MRVARPAALRTSALRRGSTAATTPSASADPVADREVAAVEGEAAREAAAQDPVRGRDVERTAVDGHHPPRLVARRAAARRAHRSSRARPGRNLSGANSSEAGEVGQTALIMTQAATPPRVPARPWLHRGGEPLDADLDLVRRSEAVGEAHAARGRAELGAEHGRDALRAPEHLAKFVPIGASSQTK